MNSKEYQRQYREKNKERLREQQKEYYEKNKERISARNKEYYRNNREKVCQRVKEYREANPELIKKRKKKWRRDSRDWVLANNASRRALHKKATPKWLSNLHKDQIREIYKKSIFYKDLLNKDFHVDHIIPLKGENVCGLHVPWNLRVVTKEFNLKKGTSFQKFQARMDRHEQD